MHVALKGGLFLTREEAILAQRRGLDFLACWQHLAYQAHALGQCAFRLRPKLHYFYHMYGARKYSTTTPTLFLNRIWAGIECGLLLCWGCFVFALGVVWFVLGCFGFNLLRVGLALGWIALVGLLVDCDLWGGVGWFCFWLAISKAYSILFKCNCK